MKPIIKFEKINLSYGEKEIFRDFSLEIMAGEKVVIYGKSGMGKSTLLKLILGFVRPESGKIVFNQKILNDKTINQLRQKIAYVDQDVVLGEGVVKEVIAEYFSFGVNRELALEQDKLGKLMKEFELESNLLDQEVDELSGGERQRLALVIALLLERSVMLLDEVTASLDPATKKLVVKNLVKRKDLMLIVVTHDQEWKSQKETKLFDFRSKQWIQ